jgi:hypothetical protein
MPMSSSLVVGQLLDAMWGITNLPAVAALYQPFTCQRSHVGGLCRDCAYVSLWPNVMHLTNLQASGGAKLPHLQQGASILVLPAELPTRPTGSRGPRQGDVHISYIQTTEAAAQLRQGLAGSVCPKLAALLYSGHSP